jgi:hypothetical protein
MGKRVGVDAREEESIKDLFNEVEEECCTNRCGDF